MRVSASNIAAKVRVVELARLLAESKATCCNSNRDEAEPLKAAQEADDWYMVPQDKKAQLSLSVTDVHMLLRVRGGSVSELRQVSTQYEMPDAAREALQNTIAQRHAIAEHKKTNNEDPGDDPWCVEALWRETSQMVRRALRHAPPSASQCVLC